MRNLYVYADETECQLSQNKRLVGVGLLVCEQPISHAIVSTALAGLKDDPDRHKDDFRKRDSRTLRRQYFHASDDSKNGHSHFCRSINASIVGNFHYSYSIVPPNIDQTVSYLQEVELCLNTIGILTLDTCVHLCVEARPQFGASALKGWVERFYQTMEHSVADLPMMPAIFPRIKPSIGRKENPGLQVVDFLLWAMNRKHFDQPDDRWFSRLELPFLVTFQREGKTEYHGRYCFKRGVLTSECHYPEAALDMESKLTSDEQMVHAYLLIERAIRGIYVDLLPEHIVHFKENVQAVQFDLRELEEFLPETLERLCSLFVRLFDTAPLYGDMAGLDLNEAAAWLHARRLAALCLRSDQANGMRCRGSFMRVRREIARFKPELLSPDSLPAVIG